MLHDLMSDSKNVEIALWLLSSQSGLVIKKEWRLLQISNITVTICGWNFGVVLCENNLHHKADFSLIRLNVQRFSI